MRKKTIAIQLQEITHVHSEYGKCTEWYSRDQWNINLIKNQRETWYYLVIKFIKLYSIDGCIERPFRRIYWAERCSNAFLVEKVILLKIDTYWMRKCENYEHEILLNWKINGGDWPNRYHICILSCTSIACIFSKPFIYYYIAFIAFKCKKEIYYDCQLYFILTKQKKKQKMEKKMFNNTVLRPYSISTSAWSELFILFFFF